MTSALFHLPLVLLLAAAMPFATASEWSEPNASFRLEVEAAEAGWPIHVELGGLLLPVKLGNGVAVVDAAGKRLPHSLNLETFDLFVGAEPQGGAMEVYFGFKDNAKVANTWDEGTLGAVPKPESLRLRVMRSRMDNTNESMVVNKIKELERSVERESQDGGDAGELAKLRRELARERDKFQLRQRMLERLFESKGELGIKAADKVSISENPFSRHRDFAAIFEGKLKISEPGTYTFAINSRDSSFLKINDETVVSWLFQHQQSVGWEKTGEIHLEPGLHDCRFIYQTNRGGPFAAAAWRLPGEKDFRVLEERDFFSGWRGQVSGISDSDGAILPLLKLQVKGHIFIDRDELYDWISCSLVEQRLLFQPLWKIDGEVVSREKSICLAMRQEETPEVVLAAAGGEFPDFRVRVPSELLKRGDDERHYLDIDLKLWTPDYIFEDETLPLTSEIIYNLPVDGAILMKTVASRENPVFASGSRLVTMRGRGDYETDRFAPPTISKETIKINGADLGSQSLRVDFSLELPPLSATEQSLRFLPLAECAEIERSPEGFVDVGGRRVVPILRRPTLAEKRRWSVLRTITRNLGGLGKVLVIADDFGGGDDTLRTRLAAKLGERGASLEFVPWTRRTDTSTMSGNLGAIIKAISQSNAERVVLVPSSWDADLGVEPRHQLRTLAAIIQTVNANENVKGLTIATPMPTFDDTTLEHEVARGIRQQLRQEYGIERIADLNALLKSKPDWKKYYFRDADSPLVMDIHPTRAVKEIAAAIVDAL